MPAVSPHEFGRRFSLSRALPPNQLLAMKPFFNSAISSSDDAS